MGSSEIYAQNQRIIDSLEHSLGIENSDTVKVEILNCLSVEFRKGEYDKAFNHAKEARELAEATNFNKGLADAINNQGIIYYHKGNYSEALAHYEKALKIRNQINDEKE